MYIESVGVFLTPYNSTISGKSKPLNWCKI